MVYPKDYNKETFIGFLQKNNVSDKIIEKFKELPETILLRNSEYKLIVSTTWYSVGNTYYNFELNYYSEELAEYLFSLKVFTDIDKSINFILSELIKSKFVIK
jgi:hypothetical protein